MIGLCVSGGSLWAGRSGVLIDVCELAANYMLCQHRIWEGVVGRDPKSLTGKDEEDIQVYLVCAHQA